MLSQKNWFDPRRNGLVLMLRENVAAVSLPNLDNLVPNASFLWDDKDPGNDAGIFLESTTLTTGAKGDKMLTSVRS